MNVWVSAHAADRFAERVRPGLGRGEAARELERLCREFGQVVPWPDWAEQRADLKASQAALEICDGVIAVVALHPSDVETPGVITVKTRGGHAEGQFTHRGRQRRAGRRARRVALYRASRPGRRVVPGFDEGEAA